MDHQEKIARFEALVLRHLDSAFNLARWFTHNDDDARDLVQEAALRAFKAFESFKGNDGKVWLLVIVRNLFYTSISRKPQEPAVFDEEVHGAGEPSANPEVLLFRDIESRLVRQAIEQLGPEFREVLVLRELEGLSYREIAAVTNSPLGTVMSRLARGREHLRQALASYMKGRTGQKGNRNAVSGK
ncbi:MAG TPA: sigma-70 family RNA polymerase sigma factor [Candidatus Saccharimonadales bacterium]|jgi:RNA polymerase sigma factor (sigma-70 family)|nr:sigma-70 family RNA polymerase sigma factor [Candidatus Saccharimonadales bacterium]